MSSEGVAGGRTAGRCILMPGLSSILESVPSAKFTERSVASAEVASATSLRPGGSRKLQRPRDQASAVAPYCLEAAAVLRVFAQFAA